LRGPSSSLAPFLEKASPDHSVSSASSGEISIRVYLLRQVVVKVFDEQKTVSNQILGEAKIRYSSPLPRNHHSYRNHPLGEGIDCLDWDGELRSGEGGTVASFVTDKVAVRVRLEPLSPRFPF